MLDFLLGADYQYVSFFSALVAQLDRVLDYESSGQRFESSRVHHFFPLKIMSKTKLSRLIRTAFRHSFG